MVIKISYNKQTWNEYDPNKTADENLANGGIISSDRLNHIENGISSNDTEKVTDNKDGTEQLNGVQVQPFNKLNDTIGGRNYLINTSISSTNGKTTLLGASPAISGVYSRTDSYEQLTTSGDGELFYRFVEPDTNNLYNLTPGETYTLSGSASHTSGVLDFRAEYSTDRISWSSLEFTTATSIDLEIPVSDGSVFTPFSHTFTIPVGATGAYFSLENFGYTTGGLFRFKNMKLEQGSIATDWTPAPEDKADDSKVVHSTITQLSSTDMNTVLTAGFYKLISGTNGMPNADAWTIYQVIPLSSTNGVQVTYGTNNTILGMRSWNYDNPGTLGFTSWVQFADDSKVAHLSGANNFDTVPTYGNNEIPLALNNSGSTTNRPTGQVVGYQYFDTTLNKPIWYNGSNWVDSTGTTV